MPLKRIWKSTISNAHRIMAAAVLLFTAVIFGMVFRQTGLGHSASEGTGHGWLEAAWSHAWIVPAGILLAWGVWILARENVTRRLISEQAMAEREKSLQDMADIFDRTTAGLFTMPAHEDKYEMVNHAYAAMHGYSLAEIKLQSPLDLVAPDHRERARKGRHVSPLVAHMGHEVEHLRKDGTTFTALESVRARMDSQGRLLGYIVNVMDITNRKRAEMEIHRLGTYLKSVLDQAPFAIITADNRGLINFFNQSAEKLLGYRREDVVGKMTPLHFHQTGEIRARIQSLEAASALEVLEEFRPFLALLSASGPVLSEDWHLMTQGGTTVQVQAHFSAIADDNGQILGYLEVLENVAEKRRLETEKGLYQRMSALGQLAAGIAHEINTPMQFISDNVEFFRDNFFNLVNAFDAMARKAEMESATMYAEEMRDILKRADYDYMKVEIPKAIKQTMDGAQRVNEIVGSLKNLSHVDSSNFVAVDCNRILNDALVITRNVWKKVANASEEFEAELPLVEASPGELSQVFINLILNAADAMKVKSSEEKGALILRSRTCGENCVELSISDSGPGIPDEVQEKVFEPFFTTKPFGEGTGQGLYISRKIITEKHQGKIFFSSSPAGTTFFIQLPLKPARKKIEPMLVEVS